MRRDPLRDSWSVAVPRSTCFTAGWLDFGSAKRWRHWSPFQSRISHTPPPRSPNHFNIKSLQSIPSWSIINRLIANWITCINFNEFNQVARGLINEPNGNWIALIFSILAIQSTWSTFINRLSWSLHFQFGFEANDRLMAHNCCFWW